MANISSAGIGSGLDISSIITQLMKIESAPKDKLAAEATKTQTQISELGKITSAVSKLRELSTRLASTTFWQQTGASSSSNAVAVTSSSSAKPGNYEVHVQQLATSQSVVAGQTFAAATDPVGTGTLTFDLGSWSADGSSFTARSPAATTSVEIEATDTLETLRDKINASGAGVTATILTDASGARLVMRSKDSGVANGFSVSVTNGTDALTSFAYEQGNQTAGTATRAADALATINGLAVTSPSNTMSNVLDGVSFTFTAETLGVPVTVRVASDTEAIKKTLTEFAAAYSSIVSTIAADTRYDATAKKAGILQGDSTVVGVVSRMRAILGQVSSASSAFPRLSDLGFEQQRDGTLTVNDKKLSNALSDLEEVRKAFANLDTGDGQAQGFARRFSALADSLINVDGTLSSRTNGLNDKLRRNAKDQDAMDVRLARIEARLQAQYGALDTKVSSANALQSYVTQQISLWNKSNT